MTNVYIVEYESPAAFTTARKAMQDAIDNGYGDAAVFIGLDDNNKSIEYPLNKIEKAIAQLHKRGFITCYQAGGDSLTITQSTLR